MKDNLRIVGSFYVTSDEADVSILINTPPIEMSDAVVNIAENYKTQIEDSIAQLEDAYGVADFRPMTKAETEAYVTGTHRHNVRLNENSHFRH